LDIEQTPCFFVDFVDHDVDHHRPSIKDEAFGAGQIHDVDHELQNLACRVAHFGCCACVVCCLDQEFAVAEVAAGRGHACLFFPCSDCGFEVVERHPGANVRIGCVMQWGLQEFWDGFGFEECIGGHFDQCAIGKASRFESGS
jgi:hypothetical protein